MNLIQQRIAILEDALAQVIAGIFIARCGQTIRDRAEIFEFNLHGDDEQIQPVLLKAKKCEVCARGALFLSSIRVLNKLTYADERVIGYNTQLKKYFTKEEIDEIEQKFEVWDTKYIKYAKYKPQTRLARILKELIKAEKLTLKQSKV